MSVATAYDDGQVRLIHADVIDGLRSLAAESVHCVVTSPPYYGLRDYGVEGQIGLEATPKEFIARMVGVFREVWRVLRKDGTAWVNMGDSYAAQGGGGAAPGATAVVGNTIAGVVGDRPQRHPPIGLKPKDLMGMPWRLALALQADGWWLRQDIIWHKTNPMPESVTDRCTKAHEYVFLLAKAERYYYDAFALREPYDTANERHEGASGYREWHPSKGGITVRSLHPAGRNKRSVWSIPSEARPEAHFATFPSALVVPCIQAGTSEYGCCSACGAPWVRELAVADPAGRLGASFHDHVDDAVVGQRGVPPAEGAPVRTHRGWSPSCACGPGDGIFEVVEPCTVLDPFMGSGTTARVARQLGRKAIGIELNAEYLEIAKRHAGGQLMLGTVR